MRKTWQWLAGLLFAGALLVLRPAPDALAVESAHPIMQDVPACPTVGFTKTVAVSADPCAVTTTAVEIVAGTPIYYCCLLYTSPSPRD